MNDIQKLTRIQLIVIALFVINKFIIRPKVMESADIYLLQVFVLSFPNFCEAIIGVTFLTYLGLTLNNRSLKLKNRFSDHKIYVMATLVAGLYVILQEFKIHNIGGKNAYDPYDVAFSIAGLILGYVLLQIIKPQIEAR